MNNSLIRPAGTHLYKYAPCKLEWLEPIITKGEVYFPTPNQLNDPAEAKPRISKLSLEKISSFLYDMFVTNNPALSPDAYKNAKAQIEINGTKFGPLLLLKEISKTLHSELETLRIYSMSKRPDNMALWANYADNHKGYCLEFFNSGLFAAAREISYSDIIEFDPTDPEKINAYFLFQKTLEWQTEEEVRLVAPRGSGPIVQFDPNLLTRIIAGQHMQDEKLNVIRKWASLRSPKLSLFHAEFGVFEQKLKFHPVQ